LRATRSRRTAVSLRAAASLAAGAVAAYCATIPAGVTTGRTGADQQACQTDRDERGLEGSNLPALAGEEVRHCARLTLSPAKKNEFKLSQLNQMARTDHPRLHTDLVPTGQRKCRATNFGTVIVACFPKARIRRIGYASLGKHGVTRR
jgi:hypothetical protein